MPCHAPACPPFLHPLTQGLTPQPSPLTPYTRSHPSKVPANLLTLNSGSLGVSLHFLCYPRETAPSKSNFNPKLENRPARQALHSDAWPPAPPPPTFTDLLRQALRSDALLHVPLPLPPPHGGEKRRAYQGRAGSSRVHLVQMPPPAMEQGRGQSI